MRHLDANNLLQYASHLKGQRLFTISREKPFTVRVTPDGLEITPGSTGEPRKVSAELVQRVCDEYSQSKSTSPGDYQRMTFDASYLIALIDGFQNQR